jgi:hypothetical protein
MTRRKGSGVMRIRTRPSSTRHAHFPPGFPRCFPWNSVENVVEKCVHRFSTGFPRLFGTGNIIANMPGQILFPRYRCRGKWKMETLLLHLPVRPDLLKSVWTPLRSGQHPGKTQAQEIEEPIQLSSPSRNCVRPGRNMKMGT